MTKVWIDIEQMSRVQLENAMTTYEARWLATIELRRGIVSNMRARAASGEKPSKLLAISLDKVERNMTREKKMLDKLHKVYTEKS